MHRRRGVNSCWRKEVVCSLQSRTRVVREDLVGGGWRGCLRVGSKGSRMRNGDCSKERAHDYLSAFVCPTDITRKRWSSGRGFVRTFIHLPQIVLEQHSNLLSSGVENCFSFLVS